LNESKVFGFHLRMRRSVGKRGAEGNKSFQSLVEVFAVSTGGLRTGENCSRTDQFMPSKKPGGSALFGPLQGFERLPLFAHLCEEYVEWNLLFVAEQFD